MKDMIITDEMQKVMDLITGTKEHVFVTGKAGTGKTTFLRRLAQECRELGKQYAVTAPTGVAAIHARGMTLNSLLCIPFGPKLPKSKLDHYFSTAKTEMLLQLDVLIIDEVSMVRCDMMDTVDRQLRWVRESDEPFGGVQVVMFGDLYQLPPVVKSEDMDILKRAYTDFYFFNAVVWQKCGFHVVELTRIFRQTDTRFVDLLNNVRTYSVTADDLDTLGELKDKTMCNTYDNGFIHICTHKKDVERINSEMLGEYEAAYHALIRDQFPESSAPCDLYLPLRKGARVMSLINDLEKGCFNGMLGYVEKLGDKKVEVKMDNGRHITFEPYKWTNIQYVVKNDEIEAREIGSCTQIPLRLAWAITIHKSQGLTFDKVAVHIAKTFCPGQLYVALSRCRTLEGIVSDAYVTRRMIIPEYALTDFERAYKAEDGWYGHREKKEEKA